uniref:OSJNBa0085C10.31 protein n=1 Tax=Oryza sativa subsp. japonica TaxID=39947 RepID=Q5JPW0_ORYSJ|nr:OSJNBa0085C10.31 [Oryza sativa Japonica Group]
MWGPQLPSLPFPFLSLSVVFYLAHAAEQRSSARRCDGPSQNGSARGSGSVYRRGMIAYAVVCRRGLASWRKGRRITQRSQPGVTRWRRDGDAMATRATAMGSGNGLDRGAQGYALG